MEIGAIELINGKPTGRTYHQYINPERPIPDAVVAIHGIDNAKVVGKPPFKEIANDFYGFIGADGIIVAHNAPFDMRFINAELSWAGLPPIDDCRIIDTVSMARQLYPGTQTTLDALCKRFGIDNRHRTTHGALLDAELLLAIYACLKEKMRLS